MNATPDADRGRDAETDLDRLLPVDPADLDRLRARLAGAAADEGLVDVAFSTVDSPLGRLLVAVTDAGLVRVAFERQGFDAVLADLAERIGPRVVRDDARLEPVARELGEYFAGGRRTFDIALDQRLSAGFRGEVQQALPGIPYGTTTSYGDLAERVGNPRAVRAVGTACATNPIPIVVPCHRVLRADGSTGEYVGGPEAKIALLELERAA